MLLNQASLCPLASTKTDQLVESRFPCPPIARRGFVFFAVGTAEDSPITGKLRLPPVRGPAPKIFPMRLLFSIRPPWGRSCGFPIRRAYVCCQANSERRASLVAQRPSRCSKIRLHRASLVLGELRGLVIVRLVRAEVVVEWERWVGRELTATRSVVMA